MILKTSFGAGEMAELLEELVSLPEDLGSVSRTHMVAYNHYMGSDIF